MALHPKHAGLVLSALALVALSAAPAAAHVTISPSTGEAGAFTVLTVSVPHGCEGSPTTKVALRMPEEITDVTPTRDALWEVEKVMETLEEPLTDTHGNEVTERVDQVVYTTDDPLPEGYRDAFELSLQLPDTPGATLAFPVIQTCEDGETAWVETSEDGSTGGLEAPAPTVTLQAADDEAAGAEAGDDDTALAVAALVAGVLGLVAGVTALVAIRRRP